MRGKLTETIEEVVSLACALDGSSSDDRTEMDERMNDGGGGCCVVGGCRVESCVEKETNASCLLLAAGRTSAHVD